jgi:hypothetical protein
MTYAELLNHLQKLNSDELMKTILIFFDRGSLFVESLDFVVLDDDKNTQHILTAFSTDEPF